MTLRFTSTSNIKFWCISNVPRSVFVNEANCNFMTFVMWRPWHLALGDFPLFLYTKVCLKKHSCNLHAPLCGIFRPNSVVLERLRRPHPDKISHKSWRTSCRKPFSNMLWRCLCYYNFINWPSVKISHINLCDIFFIIVYSWKSVKVFTECYCSLRSQ